MKFFPRHSSYSWQLYRIALLVVTVAASMLSGSQLSAQGLTPEGITPQYGHKTAPDKGPRALGLVQIPVKGKARLIPIAIMMDGKFYDASAYKADPVPLALDFGVVYEGFRAGVTQGIFTITQPGQLNHTWIAEGKWLPAGMEDPNKKKKYAPPVIADDDKDDRPVLHRRVPKSDDSGSSSDNKDTEKNKNTASSSPASPSAAPASGAPTNSSAPASSNTNPSDASKDARKATTPATSERASASDADENIGDPNRPRLRRGKPDKNERHEPFTTFDPLPVAAPGGAAGPAKADIAAKDSAAPTVTTIPAISDAHGPEPRSYAYDIKPAEEAIYRNKMFALATDQLHAHVSAAAKDASASKSLSTASTTKSSASKSANKSSAKLAQPSFDDVSLRIFDLSSSNEPVLVLSAKTHLPASDGAQYPKEITLIARTNLEGELRKLFFSVTDSGHLDATPRMQLIDAVDADGDGRGELLFRRTFDDGSAYAIYRVAADRLWPLFEGTP